MSKKIAITKQKFQIIFFMSFTIIFLILSIIIFPKGGFKVEFTDIIEGNVNETINKQSILFKELITKPSFPNMVRNIIQVPFDFNKYRFCIINNGYIRDVKNERIISTEINITFGGKNYLVKQDKKICDTIEIGREYNWNTEVYWSFIKFPGLVPLGESKDELDFSHYFFSFSVETEKSELWGKRILTIVSLFALLWLISRIIYLFFDFEIWRDLEFKK